ncbi:MAG: Peptidoglycan glycosyltransferase MrdB [Chlamydiia bacterium]|nr:Peptidoglycan glycosyltransferase MrdB [Chlamydiia bacterium]
MQQAVYFRRLDYRLISIVLILMVISLLVIASAAVGASYYDEVSFFTPAVIRQMLYFSMGWGVFLALSYMDYRKLRGNCVFLYVGIIILLLGLFFTTPIQNVRRWYRLPIVNFAFQPSEYAKLIVVIVLSYFLEKKKDHLYRFSTVLQALLLVFIPFALIYKQPDLGTALVLFPICFVMFYFGGISKKVVFVMSVMGATLLALVLSMFLGLLSHEKVKPYALKVIKEYQYDRLDPDTYHQKCAQIAIALGSITGSGWKKSEFTGKRWLPFAETDSVFPAYTEQFGLIGALFLLLLFFGLIYFSFQVVANAKDPFGRLVSSGIAVYLAIHVIINIGMMCGLLPITGVPLLLVSFGGSSTIATMAALGVLQSIYIRRFMF